VWYIIVYKIHQDSLLSYSLLLHSSLYIGIANCSIYLLYHHHAEANLFVQTIRDLTSWWSRDFTRDIKTNQWCDHYYSIYGVTDRRTIVVEYLRLLTLCKCVKMSQNWIYCFWTILSYRNHIFTRVFWSPSIYANSLLPVCVGVLSLVCLGSFGKLRR